MPSSRSTRWYPTAEQLMILEEIYKGLIRTPNASQMQQITAHLSQYGKIEGKNVFYWFQNHKARDRQRLRKKQLFLAKQMQNNQQQQQQHHLHHHQQQQNYHRELDHVLQCTSVPPLDPSLIFHYKSPAFPNQGGVEDACYSEIMKHYKWKLDLPVETCMNKRVKNKYCDDDMRLTTTITKDVRPSIASTTCCSRGSPQTLQLFPTKSTDS